MSFPEYKIESINDFTKIPEDKIEECLANFMECLKVHRIARKVVKEFMANHGYEFKEEQNRLPYFIWIDDGQVELKRIDFVELAEAHT
jgi:hypothetical protein